MKKSKKQKAVFFDMDKTDMEQVWKNLFEI